MSNKKRGDKSLFIKDYLKLYTGKKVKGLGGRENKAKRVNEKRRERVILKTLITHYAPKELA